MLMFLFQLTSLLVLLLVLFEPETVSLRLLFRLSPLFTLLFALVFELVSPKLGFGHFRAVVGPELRVIEPGAFG